MRYAFGLHTFFAVTLVVSLEPLKLNNVVTVGTWNSYHHRTQHQYAIPGTEYDHSNIDVQLNYQQVRHFDLALNYQNTTAAPTYAGFPQYGNYFVILAFPFYDEQTTCYELTQCLSIIANWQASQTPAAPLIVVHLNFLHNPSVFTYGQNVFKFLESQILSSVPRCKLFAKRFKVFL